MTRPQDAQYAAAIIRVLANPARVAPRKLLPVVYELHAVLRQDSPTSAERVFNFLRQAVSAMENTHVRKHSSDVFNFLLHSFSRLHELDRDTGSFTAKAHHCTHDHPGIEAKRATLETAVSAGL